MNWLFVISCIATITEITSYIEERVVDYFNSALLKETTTIWRKHAIAYQNTLALAMQETYGFMGMNVYMKRSENPLFVSKGYYHTDNQVHIVLQNMRLDNFPHISDIVITFPLTSNVIKMEGVVSKMIIHSNYYQFRNKSDIVYDLRKQDSYNTSPFLFEQVKSEGQLAIQVEGCKLSGIGIVSLTGHSVTLGNAVFRLLHCQYNFEIFAPGVASPPVIADYLPHSEGLNIDRLMMMPLEAELVPRLQAALHTHVNTSAIFQQKLPEIRNEQEKIFEQTTNYANNVIRNMNVLTITKNAGKIVMEDFRIYWNETFKDGPANSVVTLSNLVLTGLETVYSSHSGGPFKLTTIKISEELRFGTLQVRGSIDMQLGDKTLVMNDFAVEINDVEVDVTANLQKADKENLGTAIHIVEVMGWRSFQFSSPGMTLWIGETLITGYLLTKVPIYLTNYLNNIISDAVREADNEYKMLAGDDKLVLGAPNPSEASNAGDGNDVQDQIENKEEDDLGNKDENIDDGQDNVIEDGEGEGPTSPGSILDDETVGLVDEDGFVSPRVISDDEPENTGGILDDTGNVAPDGSFLDAQTDQEYLPDDKSDQLELQAKFFDENMFADAQNLG